MRTHLLVMCFLVCQVTLLAGNSFIVLCLKLLNDLHTWVWLDRSTRNRFIGAELHIKFSWDSLTLQIAKQTNEQTLID